MLNMHIFPECKHKWNHVKFQATEPDEELNAQHGYEDRDWASVEIVFCPKCNYLGRKIQGTVHPWYCPVENKQEGFGGK